LYHRLLKIRTDGSHARQPCSGTRTWVHPFFGVYCFHVKCVPFVTKFYTCDTTAQHEQQYRPTEGRRLSRPGLHLRQSNLETVIHPSTNWAQRRLTLLIKTNDATPPPNLVNARSLAAKAPWHRQQI